MLRVATAVLLVAFAVGTGVAGEKTDLDLGAALALGYDTNPVRVSGDGPNGRFAELRLDAAIGVEMTERSEFFVDLYGRARRYESEMGNGDTGSGTLRVGVAISPIRVGRSRMAVAFGGLYDVRRSTFVDRATGDVFEVFGVLPLPPGSIVPIPDRFDSNTGGAFVDLRWKPSRRIRFSLEGVLENTDYVNDYDVGTGLYALDYRALTIEPGMRIRVNPLVTIGASWILTDMEYDEQPALDGNGYEVPGTIREYRYGEYRVTLRLTPGDRWRISLGHRGGNRDDTFAGYYDFGASSSYIAVDHRPVERARVQIYASLRDLDYENATVPGDTSGETRGNETQRYVSRFDWKLVERLAFFVEGGVQRTDSQDPIFAYDRDWVLAGIQFRR